MKILLKLNKNYFYGKFLYENGKITKILDKIIIKKIQKCVKTIVNTSLYIHMLLKVYKSFQLVQKF